MKNSQQLPKSDEWQEFLSHHHNKFLLTNLILDSSLGKASFPNYLYLTKGQFCCQQKLHSTINFVEVLFSNHMEANQKITNHVLFASSPESSVCVVSDETDIYVLMLYIAKHCNKNMYFRQETHS